MGFDNHEIQFLTADDLFVDPEIQRRLVAPWASKLIGRFNPSMMGVLTGSKRTNGKVALVDGQHRFNAALSSDFAGKFEVNVYYGLNKAEEVQLFLALNDSRQVGALDEFRIRLAGGDDMVANALNKILTDNGWEVNGTKRGNSTFAAVTTLERLYLRDPDTAHRVIYVPTSAWGHEGVATDNRIIDGLGRVLLHYKQVWDNPNRLDDLIEKLSRYVGGPANLIAAGQQLARLQGWRVGHGVGAVIVGEYNKNKRLDGPNILPELPRTIA